MIPRSLVQSGSAKQWSLSFVNSDCINVRQWMICFASTVLYTVHCLKNRLSHLEKSVARVRNSVTDVIKPVESDALFCVDFTAAVTC